MPFEINDNIFEKCAPALSTNIKQCGTVTLCQAKPLTQGDLTTAYMKSGEYRVMEALLHNDFEIKMCETVQNGLYDFLMANKQNWSNKMKVDRLNTGLLEIAPFVKGKQYSPINNAYWEVADGLASGSNWLVTVRSTTNIPADVRSFPVDQRVFIDGKSAGGSSTKTAWKIVTVTDNGDNSLELVLEPQNSASHLDADKLGEPVTGIMRRGTANKNDFEQFCSEAPAYLNWKHVPFWVETTRHSMCKSSLYDQWRKLLLENNPLYREFGDLDDIEKNRQLSQDWQRRLVDQMFWGKPLANQTLADYDQLEDITTFDGGEFGVDGAKCIGKRANAVGLYEQLAECNRVFDAQGDQLNLPDLFAEIYNIVRVRQGNGQKNPTSVDIFTDTVTAELINQAMIKYYAAKSEDQNGETTLRLTMNIEGFSLQKKADFGFLYRSYPLFWPAGVTINIVTHYFFDDWLTAAASVSQEDTARVIWILDFSGIYPGIIASNRVVHNTGELNPLAKIRPTDYACVMKVHTQEQTLMSLTWTFVIECPKSNLIIENISSVVPEHATAASNDYGGTGSATTTTTTQHH